MEVYFCFHEGVNHSGAELMEFLRIHSSDGGILLIIWVYSIGKCLQSRVYKYIIDCR